jgi:hypothetical protein
VALLALNQGVRRRGLRMGQPGAARQTALQGARVAPTGTAGQVVRQQRAVHGGLRYIAALAEMVIQGVHQLFGAQAAGAGAGLPQKIGKGRKRSKG